MQEAPQPLQMKSLKDSEAAAPLSPARKTNHTRHSTAAAVVPAAAAVADAAFTATAAAAAVIAAVAATTFLSAAADADNDAEAAFLCLVCPATHATKGKQ